MEKWRSRYVRRVMFTGYPRACAPTAPRRRGCWRSPVLLAEGQRGARSGHLAGIRANRHTRPLLRTPLGVWIGIQRETGFVWPTGSCCVSMSQPAAAGARRPWPRWSAAACGRTSERPRRTDASVQRDPRAASRDLEQLECHAELPGTAWCHRRVLHFLHLQDFSPYFSTFDFALSTFCGGRHA